MSNIYPCSKCSNYPRYVITQDPSKVRISCPDCGKIEISPVSKLLSSMKSSDKSLNLYNMPEDKSTRLCTFLKTHNTIPASSYCVQCKKWLCTHCVNLHENMGYDTKHDIQTEDFVIVNKCFKHNEEYSHFCSFCQRNLCEKCWMEVCPVNIGIHQEGLAHVERHIDRISKDHNFSKNIEKRLNTIENDWKKIEEQKTNIVNKLKDYVVRITKSFEETEKQNKAILKLANNILTHSEQSCNTPGINYNPFLNFYQLCTWTKQEFQINPEDFNTEVLEDYIKYLQRDLLLDNKSLEKPKLNECQSMKLDNEITSFLSHHSNAFLGLQNGKISIIDKQLTNTIKTIEAHSNEITYLVNNNAYLISSSKDNQIKFWDLPTITTQSSSPTKPIQIITSKNEIQHLTLIGNNFNSFLSYSSFSENKNQIVEIYDIQDITQINLIEQIQFIDEDIIAMTSYNNKYLVMASKSQKQEKETKIKLWDMACLKHLIESKYIPCDGPNCLREIDGYLVICGDLTVTVLTVVNDLVHIILKTKFDNIRAEIDEPQHQEVFEGEVLQYHEDDTPKENVVKYKMTTLCRWSDVDDNKNKGEQYFKEYEGDYFLFTNDIGGVHMINLENKYDYANVKPNDGENCGIKWELYTCNDEEDNDEENIKKGYYAIEKNCIKLYKVEKDPPKLRHAPK